MIPLLKNTTNDVTVTVTEKVTLTGTWYYLFEFIHEQENTSKFCIQSNTSTETARYDSFSIQDVVSPNPLSGQVDLTTGTHVYNIYEMTGDPLMLVNPYITANGNLLETGLAKMTDATENTNTEYPDAVETNTVYG